MNTPSTFSIRRRFSEARGFSLVEVVLALGISAFAMTTIMALLPTGLTTARECRGDMEATRTADQVMEDLRAAQINSAGVFESARYNIDFSADPPAALALPGEGGFGQQLAEISFVNRPGSNGDEPGLYEVVVKVHWGVPEGVTTAPASNSNHATLYGAFTK